MHSSCEVSRFDQESFLYSLNSFEVWNHKIFKVFKLSNKYLIKSLKVFIAAKNHGVSLGLQKNAWF